MTTDSRKEIVKYRTLKAPLLIMQWSLMLSCLAIMYFGKMAWFGKICLSGMALFGSFTFFKLQAQQNKELLERYREAFDRNELHGPLLRRAKKLRAQEEYRLYVKHVRNHKRKFKRKQ